MDNIAGLAAKKEITSKNKYIFKKNKNLKTTVKNKFKSIFLFKDNLKRK